MRKQDFSFRKRLLVCVLTLLMVCGMAPGVFAEETSGQTGEVTTQTVETANIKQTEAVLAESEEEIKENRITQVDEANLQDVTLGSVRIKGSVDLNGKDLTADEFVFTVKDVTDSKNKKTVATAKNDKDGNFDFTVYFDDIGEYSYELSQNTVTESGVTIDTHVYPFKIKVDKDTDGKPTVKVTDESNNEIDVEKEVVFKFKNQFSNSSSKDDNQSESKTDQDADIKAEYGFTGKVSLTGKTLAKDEFSFTLEDTTESTPEADRKTWTVKNDSSGNFVFDAITYEKAGEYTYTISQVKNTESGMTNDTNVYKATVTVTAADDGTLTTKLTKLTKGTNDTDVLSSGISFSNQYVTPTTTNTTTTPSTTTTTPSTGTADATTARATSNPSTGDTSDIGFYTALLAGFVIVLVCTLFSFRRKKGEK